MILLSISFGSGVFNVVCLVFIRLVVKVLMLNERVNDTQGVVNKQAMMHIFGIKNIAARFQCSGNNFSIKRLEATLAT